MDKFAHETYALTRKFPREELFGITSQLRRAALSVVLNYVEGFARKKSKGYRYFLQISFGSLKESQYLIEFAVTEGYVKPEDAITAKRFSDEIGAMLWKALQLLEEDLNQ